MKLLLDMNLSPKWVDLLHKEGWETSHWSQIGGANASDAEIVAYAASSDFVIITHDLDFGAILAVTHGSKPSVIQVRVGDLTVEGIGRRLLATLRYLQSELERGALITVEADRIRLRLLPIRQGEEDPYC